MSTLGYLINPALQIEDLNGKPLTGGTIRVFRHGTTIPYITWKDFTGDRNPAAVVLDAKGMAVILAEPGYLYDVYCWDKNGFFQWSRLNVPVDAGGSGSISSSDGSLDITQTETGYDITVSRDSTDLLDWVRCDGSTSTALGMIPEYSAGTMVVGDNGVRLSSGNYYHVTARLRADVLTVQPFYNEFSVIFRGFDGEGSRTYLSRPVVIDGSIGNTQEWEFSFDCLPESNVELYVTTDGLASYARATLLDMEIHRVYSGAPTIPGGVATQSWVDENYQGKLTAGSNITIDSDNVISAVVPEYANADWDATSGQPGYIYHKPDLSVYATTQDVETALEDKQDVLTAGSNITIVNNTISATAEPQVNADWNATSGVAEILNKPTIPVVPPLKELVAGTNISITEGADAVTISATAAPQVNADWDATSGVAEILNKPDLSVYAESADLATVATTGSYDDLTDKPVIPAAQVNADWDAVSGVAEILHKPSIPTATSDLQNDSGYITLADVPAQVQTDWDATSGLGQILHKPDLSIYAESADLATVATTGSYDDLLDKPTIPAAQVNADWNAVSGIAEILNKPSLATVATTGDYGDLSNTPSIPVIGTITV